MCRRLMPSARFLPPDDPRVRSTVDAIADELTDNDRRSLPGYLTDDGFASEEGTFTICTFWLVPALVQLGELERAAACSRRSSASPTSAS